VSTLIPAWSLSLRWVGLAVLAIGLPVVAIWGVVEVLESVHRSQTTGAHHIATASGYFQITLVACAILLVTFWRTAIKVVLWLTVALVLIGLGVGAVDLIQAIQH